MYPRHIFGHNLLFNAGRQRLIDAVNVGVRIAVEEASLSIQSGLAHVHICALEIIMARLEVWPCALSQSVPYIHVA